MALHISWRQAISDLFKYTLIPSPIDHHQYHGIGIIITGPSHQLSLICYFKRRHMLSISSINLIYVIYNPSISNIYQIDTQTHNRYQLNIKPFQLICNFRYSNWQFTPLKLYHSSISLICVICKLHRYRTHIKLVHNTVLTTLSSRHTWYQILLISNISDWYTAQKNPVKLNRLTHWPRGSISI